ncbi:hypothetical protein WOLCODRAFT_139660 [Wolfiporia cocos MD-104 SS10]|uniref:Lipid droplet-associated perilipin protein n=1 Tax=Wolfiporia cocos (strain MD-104) TaxID=742152 RepID=A0A2H3IYC6_WOLCO|nr:hypothetical protein WOLCODRAFT_139660 [Wolfiporia cocos MD-104 SS10]
MATQTQETSRTPELTIISRVASIPLVASSLNTIHETLLSNAYTQKPYSTAQGISKSALSYTEPLQKRLAPLIVRADGYANMGLDAVESRYPYPFKTPTEDILRDIKGRSDQARDVANKTIDERVKSPAYNVAQGIDQRFAPIVDYFEVAVNKLHPPAETDSNAEHAESQFQYQRALVLSKELLKRASETAHNITQLATTSYGTAQVKVQVLSDTMLGELQKIQATTATLPAQVQVSLSDISARLSSTITDLSAILTSPDPLQDKVHKLRDTIQERVHPLLEATTSRVQDILAAVRSRVPVGEKEAVNGHANGNGNSHD